MCFCSGNVLMHDTAARNARPGWALTTRKKGCFAGCHNKVWNTKQDEAINRLLLFRLPAHTESLFPCVF